MAGWFPALIAPVAVAAVVVAMGAAVVWVVWVVWAQVRGLRGPAPRGPGAAPAPAPGASLSQRRSGMWAVAVPATFVWIYLASLLYSARDLGISPIDDRFLSPICVLVLGAALTLVDLLLHWAAGRPERGARWARGAVIALTAVTLLAPLGRTYAYVQSALENGVPGFSDRTWAKSPTQKWLRNHPLDGPHYTHAS